MLLAAVWPIGGAAGRAGRMTAALAPRLRRILRGLRQSGLVDPEWYSARYPDVAKSGADPVAHFLHHGFRDGREPSNPKGHKPK
jgi:hypothetical protein